MPEVPFKCHRCGKHAHGRDAEYVVCPDSPQFPFRRHFIDCTAPWPLSAKIAESAMLLEDYRAHPPEPRPPVRCSAEE